MATSEHGPSKPKASQARRPPAPPCCRPLAPVKPQTREHVVPKHAKLARRRDPRRDIRPPPGPASPSWLREGFPGALTPGPPRFDFIATGYPDFSPRNGEASPPPAIFGGGALPFFRRFSPQPPFDCPLLRPFPRNPGPRAAPDARSQPHASTGRRIVPPAPWRMIEIHIIGSPVQPVPKPPWPGPSPQTPPATVPVNSASPANPYTPCRRGPPNTPTLYLKIDAAPVDPHCWQALPGKIREVGGSLGLPARSSPCVTPPPDPPPVPLGYPPAQSLPPLTNPNLGTWVSGP